MKKYSFLLAASIATAIANTFGSAAANADTGTISVTTTTYPDAIVISGSGSGANGEWGNGTVLKYPQQGGNIIGNFPDPTSPPAQYDTPNLTISIAGYGGTGGSQAGDNPMMLPAANGGDSNVNINVVNTGNISLSSSAYAGAGGNQDNDGDGGLGGSGGLAVTNVFANSTNGGNVNVNVSAKGGDGGAGSTGGTAGVVDFTSANGVSNGDTASVNVFIGIQGGDGGRGGGTGASVQLVNAVTGSTGANGTLNLSQSVSAGASGGTYIGDPPIVWPDGGTANSILTPAAVTVHALTVNTSATGGDSDSFEYNLGYGDILPSNGGNATSESAAINDGGSATAVASATGGLGGSGSYQTANGSTGLANATALAEALGNTTATAGDAVATAVANTNLANATAISILGNATATATDSNGTAIASVTAYGITLQMQTYNGTASLSLTPASASNLTVNTGVSGSISTGGVGSTSSLSLNNLTINGTFGQVAGAGDVTVSNSTVVGSTGFYNQTGGNVSLANITNSGIINQSGGNLTAVSYVSITGTTTLSNGSTQQLGVFNLTGGQASLGNISGNGTINIGSGAFLNANTLSMASGNIAVNGNVSLTSTSATRQTSAVVIEIGNLTVGTAGKIDLANHDLIIHGGSNLSQVAALIMSAYDSGAWDGDGIGSSTVASATDKALGYATAGELGISTFDGIAVSSTDILVKYTWQGDANLDGKVDLTDLNIVNSHGGTSGDWSKGDFNYDGSVNLSDLNIVLNHLGDGSSSPLGVVATPEPGSLAMLSATSMLLLRRRKRC